MTERGMKSNNKQKEKSSSLCRFYCNNNDQCLTAEKVLVGADIPFVKIESIFSDPLLITKHQICKNFEEIDRFAKAAMAMRKEYSIIWD